jgi:polysaccharide biosynthesis protein PslH
VDLVATRDSNQDDGAPQVARHRAPAAAPLIAGLLTRERFDLVHIEGFYLIQHLRAVDPQRRPPTLLVEHNIEYRLWEQRADGAPPDRRPGLIAAADSTRAAEIAAWHRADRCAALTEPDCAEIEGETGQSVALVPDGCDHLERPAPRSVRRPEAEPSCVLVGNFGYEPTVDGATWFLDEVLPPLRERSPEIRIDLVGASPPPHLIDAANRAPGVRLHANVRRVEPYLEAAAVVICPLRVGGGVKVKVLEGLAQGKAIVSTPIGMQGLESASGTAAVVAEEPEDFAAAIARLIRDPHLRRHYEREAVRFANTQLPTWDEAADQLLSVYRDFRGERIDRGSVLAQSGA